MSVYSVCTKVSTYVTVLVKTVVIYVILVCADVSTYVTDRVGTAIEDVAGYVSLCSTYVTILVACVVIDMSGYITNLATLVTIRVTSIVILMVTAYNEYVEDLLIYIVLSRITDVGDVGILKIEHQEVNYVILYYAFSYVGLVYCLCVRDVYVYHLR